MTDVPTASGEQPPRKGEAGSRFKQFLERVLEGTVVKLVVLGLAAASTGAAGYMFGARNTAIRYEQRVRAAPEEYVALLKTQIEAASRDEPESIRVRARSIIRVRDSLGGSLLNLSKHLDSEIDRLAQLLDRYEQAPTPQLEKDIGESIAVLRRTWPAKETQILYELRKVVAEIGLDRVAR